MTDAKASELITEEVVRMGIRQITQEMGTVVKRISGSTIITEADDFAAMVYGATGELLDAPFGPTYAGAGGQCVHRFLEQFGHNGFVDGDVFIANDPFDSGAMHANDMQVITPVFVRERCVGFTYMHAHVMDVGGIVPGSWGVGARDVFAESFRLPFVRYLSAGVRDETIRAIIARNTRLPDLVLNDIHGLVTATRLGAAQMQELVARYGADEFERLAQAILARTEGAAKARLATLAPATYEEIDWIEHNGHVDDLYAVRGRLTVSPDKLAFSFTGAPQTDGFINTTPSSTAGMVEAAVVGMMFYDVPFNEGILRTLSIEAKPGTVVSSVSPAPVSSNHIEGGMKVHTVAVRLLGAAMRTSTDEGVLQRAHAPFAASVTMATFAGLDRNRQYTVFAETSGMAPGGGASPGQDGLDVSAPQQAVSIRMADIESTEESHPVLFLWRRLAVDSGGPGRQRGGVGVDVAWIPYGTETLTGVVNSACGHIPALGVAGGYPGAGTNCERIEGMDVRRDWFEAGRIPRVEDVPGGVVMPTKVSGAVLKKNHVWRMREPGGGGYGDPLDRDPAAVVRDVRLGAVSTHQACSAYGAILDDSPLGFDAARTEARRKFLREARLEVGKAGRAGLTSSACPHCGKFHQGAEWLVATAPLASRLDSFGVHVEPYEGVTLEEAACPSCGSLVHVSHTTTVEPPPFPPAAETHLIL